MIQCQICQVANEDIAQFCKECGGRLTPSKPLVNSPAPAQSAQPGPAAPPQPVAPEQHAQPKPKLRSPLFGGSDADNNFDDEEEPHPVLNKPKGKGLRSPLLGAVDEDEEPAFEPKPRDSKSRGALRSPMFGGGDGGKNKEHKSTFPHRSHDIEPDHEPSPAAKLETGRHQSKGLRSPLLGGDDFDPEAGLAEEPGIQGKAAGHVKAHHRLRSPIFGTDDGYEDEDFDEEVEDVDDPNVLRSPLLAVKTPRAKTPAPAPAQAPNPQNAPPAPVVMPALPMPVANNMHAPAPYPAAPQAFAGNSPSVPPAAPTSAPRYEPKPAPSPSNSQFGMAAQAPGHYDYGVQAAPAPIPNPYPAPQPAPMPQAAPTPPAPPADSEAPKKGLRGSKLLSSGSSGEDDDDELLGPQDRRSKSRERRMSRPDRRSSASLDIDDDDDVLAPSMRRANTGASGGANPMAPLLMAAAAFAMIVKAYVFIPLLGNPDLFTKNMPYVLEQVSTMAVLLSLIMFAMKASQKP